MKIGAWMGSGVLWLIIAVENRNSRGAVVDTGSCFIVSKYWRSSSSSSSSSSSITSGGCHGLIIAGEKEVVGCNSQATWVALASIPPGLPQHNATTLQLCQGIESTHLDRMHLKKSKDSRSLPLRRSMHHCSAQRRKTTQLQPGWEIKLMQSNKVVCN